MNIYARVIQGVKWHAFESVTYQILLCSHRFVLYKVIGSAAFGALGCVFASIYGLIFLANFGFNDSIAAFFSDISICKNTCKYFFIKQGIPHFCILIAIPIVLWFLPFHGIAALPPTVFLIAAALFFAESLRITLRTLLQLTFINKQLACLDLSGLCFYLATVWSLWLWGMSLTPSVVLAPLTIISYIQVIILSIYTRSWYRSLPVKDNSILPSYTRIMRIRLFSYMHHTLSSHFMSNFLVPYTAYIWGLEYASLAKLLSSASQLITTIIKHTIGFSSMALFSHFKHASHAEKKSLFQLINRFLFATLFISIVACSVIYSIVGSYITIIPTHSALIVLLLLVLTFENCFITCESAYLSEEKPEALAIMYIIGAGTLYTLFHYQTTNHVLLLASSFLTVRLLSLCILTVILTNKWKTPL